MISKALKLKLYLLPTNKILLYLTVAIQLLLDLCYHTEQTNLLMQLFIPNVGHQERADETGMPLPK